MLGGPLVYDQAGDVTGDNLNQYAYDGEGRLCAVKTSSGIWGYLYNAEGVRVAKGAMSSLACPTSGASFSAVQELYLLDPAGDQVTELAEDADGSMNWQRTYVYAGGLIATYDPSSDTPSQPLLSFRLTDWLGTMRASTDASGVAQGTCTSLPYGDGLACQGNIPDPHHFTGKERDQESGNDYFGARYYASSMGRWPSPDPEGLFFAHPENPQSLNLYAYVQNNPLSMIDPDGLDPCPPDNESACQGPLRTLFERIGHFFANLFGGGGGGGGGCPPGEICAAPNPWLGPFGPGQWTPPANGQHYLVNSYWLCGAHCAGHWGLQLDTSNTEGFANTSSWPTALKFTWLLVGLPFHGAIRNDKETITLQSGIFTPQYFYMLLTDEQYEAAKTTITQRENHPGWYFLLFRNCALWDESVDHAAGARMPRFIPFPHIYRLFYPFE